MGKLMKLYDGEFQVSVGDELVVVGVPGYRTQTVTKVGNTYVTVMLYSTEVKFKDGVHEDYNFTYYLCKSDEGYLERKRQEEFANSIKL